MKYFGIIFLTDIVEETNGNLVIMYEGERIGYIDYEYPEETVENLYVNIYKYIFDDHTLYHYKLMAYKDIINRMKREPDGEYTKYMIAKHSGKKEK